MSRLIFLAAFGALVGFGLVLRIWAGLSCQDFRSIRLHLPIETVWETVRDFGSLQASHGRGRPLLEIESSEVRWGDGYSPGTVWRQEGRRGETPWFAEIEIVAVEAPHRLEVRLARDVFATQLGLAHHRCILELRPDGPDATTLTFHLTARTRGLRLALARTISPERVQVRLLDVGLRSLKIDLETRAYVVPEVGHAWPGVAERASWRLGQAIPAPVPAPAPGGGTFVQEQV